ncbi:MAG: SMP-30/gluconolactonase/LRE family protein, partial [Candidatus Hydrogenedentes bacterium]|nr:SMP-30/gluconolactonase/LRE family protein [Candidatus Hydrogenedentota bacterium]
MRPVLIADYECVCGEGPLWHPCEKRLYWVDIPKGRLFRYEPATAKHEQLLEGEPIGGFTFQADGAVLLFMNRGAIRSWREGAIETLLEEMPEEKETRFNDVIADAEGRVFCGTMPTKNRLGRLYCLDPDGHMVKLLDGIGCSNGMGFTPDN